LRLPGFCVSLAARSANPCGLVLLHLIRGGLGGIFHLGSSVAHGASGVGGSTSSGVNGARSGIRHRASGVGGGTSSGIRHRASGVGGGASGVRHRTGSGVASRSSGVSSSTRSFRRGRSSVRGRAGRFLLAARRQREGRDQSGKSNFRVHRIDTPKINDKKSTNVCSLVPSARESYRVETALQTKKALAVGARRQLAKPALNALHKLEKQRLARG
jgi:hypothetical protein